MLRIEFEDYEAKFMDARDVSTGLSHWENQFAEKQAANSRLDLSEPCISSYVHVVRNLDDRVEPVSIGSLPFHKIIVPLAPVRITKSINGTDFHRDRLFVPGESAVWSKAAAEQSAKTGWRNTPFGQYGFASVMISPQQMADAARTLGLDYSSLEFEPIAIRTDRVVDGLVRSLAAELEASLPAGRLYAEQIIQALGVHLTAKYTTMKRELKLPESALTKEQVQQVKDYVLAHIGTTIELSELAQQVALSKYYFARRFKKAVNESPAAFVRRLRMEKAMHLLKEENNWTLAKVAAEVGYADPSSFAKAFAQHVGMNPSEYRQAQK